MHALERDIDTLAARMAILAPRWSGHDSGQLFKGVTVDAVACLRLLGMIQRFRGRVYAAQGAAVDAVAAHLTLDGRYATPEDPHAWHVAFLNRAGDITGCLWYLRFEPWPTFDQLRLAHGPLMRDLAWKEELRAAATALIERARAEGVPCAEAGGWAVGLGSHVVDGPLLALTAFALSHHLGGAYVMTQGRYQATGGGGAHVLNKIGAQPFLFLDEVIPHYYDAEHVCEMELGWFDTRTIKPKYAAVMAAILAQLRQTTVLTAW